MSDPFAVPAAPVVGTVGPPLVAQYQGQCGACGDRIARGQMIRRVLLDGLEWGYEHLECPDPLPLEATCPTCHLTICDCAVP